MYANSPSATVMTTGLDVISHGVVKRSNLVASSPSNGPGVKVIGPAPCCCFFSCCCWQASTPTAHTHNQCFLNPGIFLNMTCPPSAFSAKTQSTFRATPTQWDFATQPKMIGEAGFHERIFGSPSETLR